MVVGGSLSLFIGRVHGQFKLARMSLTTGTKIKLHFIHRLRRKGRALQVSGMGRILTLFKCRIKTIPTKGRRDM